MKHLYFLLAAAPLFITTISAQAKILSPFDIVVYDEKALNNHLIAIQKQPDGSEWITQANCDQDMWIGSSAAEAEHCKIATPILPVANFTTFVETIVVKIETETPNTPLAPLNTVDVMSYAQSLKIQNDPSNQDAIQKLTTLNAQLKNITDMLSHLPDNPDYLERKKNTETQIAKLGKINQQFTDAKIIETKVKNELSELSESMLNLIRHKKLKNPQLLFSTSNPETDEPNSLGKSQMQGTLFKAVIDNLTTSSSTSIGYHNHQFSLDAGGDISIDGIKQNICNNCTYPVFYTDGDAVYAFITYQGKQIYEAVYQNNGFIASNFITTTSDGIYRTISVTGDSNGIQVNAMSPDGRIWQKTLPLLRGTITNGNWTLRP